MEGASWLRRITNCMDGAYLDEHGLRARLIFRHGHEPASTVSAVLGEPSEVVVAHFDTEAAAWAPNMWVRVWETTQAEVTVALAEIDALVVSREAEIRRLFEGGWNADVRIGGAITDLFVLEFDPARLRGIIGLGIRVSCWIWPRGPEDDLGNG